MHARIDALMHPHFWSLLPSRVFDWVVVAVSVRDLTTPLDTPLHPVSITSITLCAVFTGLSSFWLVRVSTVPDVVGLHHWKRTAAGVARCHSRAAHITHTHTYIYNHTKIEKLQSSCPSQLMWQSCQILNFEIKKSEIYLFITYL